MYYGADILWTVRIFFYLRERINVGYTLYLVVSLNLREIVANREKDFAPNQERKSHIIFFYNFIVTNII